MNTLQIQFMFAGLCFGIWPLFMNRSGLSGVLSSFVLCTIIVLFISPFAFGEFKNIINMNWQMTLGAAIFATLGMVLFGKGLFKASPQNVSSLFIVLVVMQVLVPAIYKIILSGGSITTKQIFGFIFAIATAILLS